MPGRARAVAARPARRYCIDVYLSGGRAMFDPLAIGIGVALTVAFLVTVYLIAYRLEERP